MNSNPVVEWVTTWGPLLTLASSIILAGVTWWLAHATKAMADSARKSARHSKAAAKASRASVAAAEAAVDVSFDVEPGMGSTVSEMLEGLEELKKLDVTDDTEVTPDVLGRVTSWQEVALTCRGATVTVHGLKITYIAVEDTPNDSAFVTLHGRSHDLDLAAKETLPRLCHAGEVIRFRMPQRPLNEGLAQFDADVTYSFGQGAARTREAKWHKPRGRLGSERPAGTDGTRGLSD